MRQHTARQQAETADLHASLPEPARSLAGKLVLELQYGDDDYVSMQPVAVQAASALLRLSETDTNARDCLRAHVLLWRLTDGRMPQALARAAEDGRVKPVPSSVDGASEADIKWVRFLVEAARQRLPQVLSAMDSSSPGDRKAACESVVWALDRRAVKPLVRILEKDTGLGMRTYAAWALGRLGFPDAVRALRRALRQREPDWDARGVVMFGQLTADPDEVEKAISRIRSGEVAHFLQVAFG